VKTLNKYHGNLFLAILLQSETLFSLRCQI